MSHPYSGAASYIYANEYLAEEDIPPRSSLYRDSEWIAAVQPSSAPATTSRAHHRVRLAPTLALDPLF
ncbi:hypothetical protein CVT26_015279 [Gymnopilus dilepis]|uniref:Uncharacterized protein n=1 Tax=Gymnopilus dilepis TaxID=231916 RepID=A0A409X0A1_9AGAR|nr:hypothetical protein CVT26_015279 [Gymnopilus dilepis]